MADYLNGWCLPPHVQREAKAAYVHRYTREHVPAWATRDVPTKFGDRYPVQFESDAEWLANTEFPVKRDRRGNVERLAHRPSSCVSHPTWPLNPELREKQDSRR